jgi:hypothetical protein
MSGSGEPPRARFNRFAILRNADPYKHRNQGTPIDRDEDFFHEIAVRLRLV